MDNSVIISSIMSRIEYYANESGISSDVEKKYIKDKISMLENNQTLPLLLYIERFFQSFNIAMGEKRTTAKMYLEGDLQYLDKLIKGNYYQTSIRKDIVLKMKPSLAQSDDGGISNVHKLTKKTESNAWKVYSNAA